MDQDYACQNYIPLHELKEKQWAEEINARPSESGDITHYSKLQMTIQH